MDRFAILSWLRETGALVTDDHFVYQSGRHGTDYFNKDAIYLHPEVVSALCRELALRFQDDTVEAVVAPAMGGITLSTWTAYHLRELKSSAQGRPVSVLALYAQKERRPVLHPRGFGYQAFEETGRFNLKRGYEQAVDGKSVLVVEDVLTTGGSVRKVVQAVRAAGGNVVGVAALCNRGGVTTHDVGDVPLLRCLINLTLESWSEDECPLCAAGVPINTTVGKGAAFLARRAG